MANKKIHATIVLEILGKPAEYITEALEKIIGEIKNEKGIEVVESEVNKPKQSEKNEAFYTNFATLNLVVDELMDFLVILFRYTPSHIEITQPDSLELKNDEIGIILNEVVTKLHKYDEIAKTISVEKNILENKLRAILEQTQGGQAPTSNFTTNVKAPEEKGKKKKGK